jgi:hypothetical protein
MGPLMMLNTSFKTVIFLQPAYTANARAIPKVINMFTLVTTKLHVWKQAPSLLAGDVLSLFHKSPIQSINFY